LVNLDFKTTVQRILVAEDADDLRDAIVMVLVESGYQVRGARDGAEAMEVFSDFKPDLAVLDMRMPRMSGAQTCAAIREESTIPIIMFTSTGDSHEVHDAISAGATDFVLKTTGISELVSRVDLHLSSPTPPKKASVQTENKTVSLIVDPDDVSRSAIKGVLARLNQESVEARSASEAVALFDQYDPDIVISEWKLPDRDAFKLFSELRSDKSIEKLMMSKRLSPEAQRKAHYVGITNFLNKPLNPAQVEVMVADCVRKAMRMRKSQMRIAV
jgi:DNA-binding response OmpR family regulator